MAISKLPEEELVGDWQLYKTPITSAIPYFYRWKINQIKLLLADLQTLKEKYGILWADNLYNAVQSEAERLCEQLNNSILTKARRRAQYEQKDKTVQPQKA